MRLTYKEIWSRSTYNIKKIVVSVVKMLIKKLFSAEAFLTVSTLPLLHIHMNLVLLLISKDVVVRMKPTLVRNLIALLFHEWHQVLHDSQIQPLLKRKMVQFCNPIKHLAPTSSTIFHATLLLSLEQCTSGTCSSSCLRVLKQKQHETRGFKRIIEKIKCTSIWVLFYTIILIGKKKIQILQPMTLWSKTLNKEIFVYFPTLYQNPPLIKWPI